ncbi:hypothetical protein QH494_17735 [Sphingomonas sp. AR_OL41]|uniref:hypothetical protein n=1 Tax=Sphingomonas sp. AR_OL41 TaxID=3042729 RepID=UPI002480B4CD|nr:hypothetical protein [Sphingomonas sp. AR_OL41]MDH7974033.1 hypothetical protein [Sphingomonas sp. AR_OL41]
MYEDYPLLRASLAPAYAEADVHQLDAIVRQIYGEGASAEDVEGLFDDIGRGLSHAAGAVGHFAQQAAPVIGRALPAMAQGAMAGSALGPWGALAGAVAGGAGGILSQSSNPTARAIGGGIGSVSNLVSTVRGGGAGGPLAALSAIGGGARGGGGNPLAMLSGGGGGAANGLFGMLARPETLQALSSAAMGSFGRQAIPVGGQQVPVHMLLSALGTLANRSAHEAAEYDESAEHVPGFVAEAGEALGVDIEDAEGRTDTLLTLLALSPSIWGPNAQARPVTVNVAPPEPAPPPAAPLVVAGEAYAIEDWENDESWSVGEAEWYEEEPAYG